MSDKITVEARVVDPGIFQLLFALGEEWSTAMREVYRRVVIRGEPWFTPGQGGVRSELIARGWSQREATSMLVAARGAQDSAVEATKFSLERSREQLVETRTQLARAQRGTSRRAIGKRHGLAGRRSRLICRCWKLEERLRSGGVRVCFGSARLARAGSRPKTHDYASRQEWRGVWERARAGQWFCQGDVGFPGGNPSARIRLSDDGKADALRLRIPAVGKLRELSGGAEWAEIHLEGFCSGRERNRNKSSRRAGLALVLEPSESAASARARWQPAAAAWANGSRPGVKRPPSTPYKARLASGPLSVRVFWRERTGGWYAGASFAPVDLPLPTPSRLMLGVDINPDHLAWSLVNRSGNPTTWGKIVLPLTGEAHHDADAIGVAVAELVAVAKSEGAAIAHEDLNFSRSRAGLRYLPRRLARLLSSFSYNQILTTLASRCAREGVRHVPVNPAWTSVLGQANYAGVHGVSVDQGAACVIARRALGFSSRLRPAVARALPGAKRPSRTGRQTGRHTHQLRRAAKAMGKRRSTWDRGGLCLRGHSAPTLGPPGKGERPALAPALGSPCRPTDGAPCQASGSHASAPLRGRKPSLTRLGEEISKLADVGQLGT
ncbi:MAG: hypothetical protein ACYCS9_00290 [Candidatus Dormibacteria bacterium]